MAGLTPEQLINQTMERVRQMGGGIVLFHDLKAVTADAMDAFLNQLKLEGYKIVHVVSNAAYRPSPELVARLDFSKQSLQTVAFTGIAPAGNKGEQRGNNVLTTGEVDIMKTEFIQIDSNAIDDESASISEKQATVSNKSNKSRPN
ncbi:MAG: hypothetical protein HC850_00565 [Rhodomicrobium sp.]|nr:hypothetical protein [Rhodomicrobium sp.]